MAPCGVETVVVDLKDEIAEGAYEAIAAQALWESGGPLQPFKCFFQYRYAYICIYISVYIYIDP